MKLIKKKIIYKLLFAFVPITILALVTTLLLSNYFMGRTVDNYVPSSNIKTAEAAALEVSGFLLNAKVSLETISDLLVQEQYSTKRSYLLKQILLKNYYYKYITLVDSDGMEIANTNIGGLLVKYNKGGIAQKAFSGNVVFSNVFLSKDDIPTVVICVPCVRWRRVEAVVCGEIDFRSIWNELDETRIGETGYAMLVTEDGKYLSHPDKSKILNLEMLKEDEKKAITDESGSYILNGEVDELATYASVGNTNWRVVIKQERKEVFRNYMLLRRSIVITTMVLVIITTGLIVFFSKTITKPIEALTNATKTIASGNLDHNIDVISDNEIGILAKSFNRMTEELKKHQQLLIQSEKLSTIGSFAASIAHEIQNPITGLLGYTYLLKKQKDEKTVEFAIDMEEELNNIQAVIERLLSVSRKTDYVFEKIQINNVIKRSTEILEHHLRRYEKVDVRLSLAEDIPEISGDIILLQQAVLNIIQNAADAIDGGGIIEIESRHDKGEVSVVISDSGKGISEGNIEKLFDPFFTTKQNESGTGLGLYITNEIMKLHNGRIDVRSKIGEGTSFALVFIDD